MRIKQQVINGTFDQDSKFKARSKFERIIEDQMRAEGRVPVLDKSTEWYTSWNDEKSIYEFSLVMFGVYVGKRKAVEEICGYNSEDDGLEYF